MLHCSCHPAADQLHSTSQRFAMHQRFWPDAIVDTLQRIKALI
jgi:hypothetical protein